MEVILSKHAGFCYGVSRAVKMARELSETQRLVTLGSIVHNKEVAKEMEGRGIKKIDSLEQVRGETVLIRSHGVPPDIFEEMKRRDIAYVDCTCPSVKKIHQIVCENYNAGVQVIIVGDNAHPEITGIKGHAGDNAIVVGSAKEFEELLSSLNGKYAMVVQTTFRRDKLDSIKAIIKKNNLDINIYDTICSATDNRQDEAAAIAKAVDYMVVIGDKKSSNTLKLFEICSMNCSKTYLIETIEDLELNIFSTDVKIGVTAGASTPPDIIKEAVFVMSDMENTKNTQTFEEMLNESFVSLHTGDIVKGTVIQVANGEVSVNLGYKSDGIIPRSEFSEDPNVDPAEVVKPGDEIEVFIARVNDSEGNVLLSKKRLDANKSLKEIEDAYNNKETVRGKIIDVVRVGLIASINGVRAFVPSSQISNRYVEDLTQFKGKEFNFDVIEFDKSKRRIVVGRKTLAAKELKESKERIFSTLEIGQTVRGVVNRIVDFGAFIDLGGIDGLVHISELSWGRVKKVTDVLKEGDEVDVTVININKDKGKISLSLKDVKNNPWNSVNERYSIGQVVDGKVVRMVPFGAFVELEEGIDGLIHISQIATKHVVKPEDELKIGEVVKVKITDINQENNRISLSKKEIDLENEKQEDEQSEGEGVVASAESEAVGEAVAEPVEEPVAETVSEVAEEVAEEAPAEETN